MRLIGTCVTLGVLVWGLTFTGQADAQAQSRSYFVTASLVGDYSRATCDSCIGEGWEAGIGGRLATGARLGTKVRTGVELRISWLPLEGPLSRTLFGVSGSADYYPVDRLSIRFRAGITRLTNSQLGAKDTGWGPRVALGVGYDLTAKGTVSVTANYARDWIGTITRKSENMPIEPPPGTLPFFTGWATSTVTVGLDVTLF